LQNIVLLKNSPSLRTRYRHMMLRHAALSGLFQPRRALFLHRL
jgi:hypothetical protein